jgi:hypothetical protein
MALVPLMVKTIRLACRAQVFYQVILKIKAFSVAKLTFLH